MDAERIVFATGNEGKMREIREILKDLEMEIISMKEAGVNLEIIENGSTFGENAEIKAKAVWKETGGIVLADDSGLVIDCLNGEPGIYSARYLGEDTSYEVKNHKLLSRAAHVKGQARSARFICNIAAVLPEGQVLHTEESMEGVLADSPAGEGGFGYDPILWIPEFGATSAELSLEQKNQISHRGKALLAMKQKLQTFK